MGNFFIGEIKYLYILKWSLSCFRRLNMAVDFVSSCFSSNYILSENSIIDYFEDFSLKNSHLPLQSISLKYNKNFLDKVFLLRFSLFQKIQASRMLCPQDQVLKKSIYSILAIPSLIADLALNEIVFYYKHMYRLPLISAIGVNLVYKKLAHPKDFEYYSSLQSLIHNNLNTLRILSCFEIARMIMIPLFLNRDPLSGNPNQYLPFPMPLALFQNKEDGTITTAFSQIRYNSPWKDYSDQQIYDLFKETCSKFTYSVKGDKIRVYKNSRSSEVEVVVASLKNEGLTK